MENNNENEISGGVEFHKEVPIKISGEESVSAVPTETVGGVEFRKEQESLLEKEKMAEDTSGLHTMARDMGKQAEQKQGSALQAILKQERELKVEQKRQQTNLIFGIVSVVIFLTALGIFFYASQKEEVMPPTQTQVVQKSIIYAENHARIDTTDILPLTLISKISQKFSEIKNAPGEVTNIYFIKYLPAGDMQTLSARAFLGAIQSSTPGILLPELGKDFMLGSFGGEAQTPFLILQAPIRSTQTMLSSWEVTLLQDMSKLFSLQITDSDLYNKAFEDIQIENKHIRALLDEDGSIILCYSYINDDLLVITTDSQTFKEILQRLATNF